MFFMRHSIKFIAVFIVAGSMLGGYSIYRSLANGTSAVSCPMWYNPDPSHIRVELQNNRYRDAVVTVKTKEIIRLSLDDDRMFRSKQALGNESFVLSVSSGGNEVFSAEAINSCEFAVIKADVGLNKIEVSCHPCATGV